MAEKGLVGGGGGGTGGGVHSMKKQGYAWIFHKDLSLNPHCAYTALALLGGSWVGMNGVISTLIWVIIIITLLIAPPITTHEPPSSLDHGRVDLQGIHCHLPLEQKRV